MSASNSPVSGATYLNPVYGREFPDPFVLKYCGEYWAYCTGFWQDGRCFGILHSPDLVNWREVGSAMSPLPSEANKYWAPEVSYYNGRFYLYYSVGNEEQMQIRVAVADNPAGPFVDSGHRLTNEAFAIDPHVFADDDGQRYMFYATDFLEHTHIGTGTVVDLMRDPFSLAGQARPVTRARYDWQVYEPQRLEKGGVRWHTVEGPFVLKHKGRYYEMFSGGNWQNVSYGVSYALSDSLTDPVEWKQVADGEEVLPILRTLPGKVIGPGHNSVVRGPDNRQLYCVYHRWADDKSGRLLAIDPLDWAGERMLVLGPSTGPVAAPLMPTFAGFSAGIASGDRGWNYLSGDWSVEGGQVYQRSAGGLAEARFTTPIPHFVAEVDLRTLENPIGKGSFGLGLYCQNKLGLRFELVPGEGYLSLGLANRETPQRFQLPKDLEASAYHLLRIELDGFRVSIRLDEGKISQYQLPAPPDEISLFSQEAAVAFAGFAFTVGWEDLFTENYNPDVYGWRSEKANHNWRVQQQQLWNSATAQAQVITKGPLLKNYEFVVNARLDHLAADGGGYGFYPAWLPEESGPLFKLEQHKAGWFLRSETASTEQLFPLPPRFDPLVYQQFRFYKVGGKVLIGYEGEMLGEISVLPDASGIALYVEQATAGFEMVRVTSLK